MVGEPYRDLAMKMTMHIDEDVLAEVMDITKAKSKTQAVEIALTEMARRHKLKRLFAEGLGLTPDELRVEFAPTAADALDNHGLNWMVAEEEKVPHAKPRRSRQ